jgi:hypothetical protein
MPSAEHLLAQRDAAGQGRLLEVADGDDHRADPLVGPRDQRLGQVLRDVHERRAAGDRDGVEGELVAVDVLLEAALVDVLGHGQGALEIGVAVELVGVGRAGAGDRLPHQRVAEPSCGGAGLGRGLDPGRARHPQAGGGDPLLHELLVAEAEHGVVAHARHAQALAQPGRGQDHDLPVGQHAIDAPAAHPLIDPLGDVGLVEEPRHLQVVGQVLLERARQRRRRRVADAVDAGPDLGQAAGVLLHLGGIGGREEDDLHGARAP